MLSDGSYHARFEELAGIVTLNVGGAVFTGVIDRSSSNVWGGDDVVSSTERPSAIAFARAAAARFASRSSSTSFTFPTIRVGRGALTGVDELDGGDAWVLGWKSGSKTKFVAREISPFAL